MAEHMSVVHVLRSIGNVGQIAGGSPEALTLCSSLCTVGLREADHDVSASHYLLSTQAQFYREEP